MSATKERRKTVERFSLREAAFVTGLSPKTINNAIDRGEFTPTAARRSGERGRLLAIPDVLYLGLRDEVGRLLSPTGKRQLHAQLAASARGGEAPSEVRLGALELKVGDWIEKLLEKLADVVGAHVWVLRDPAVLSGEPVVRGTRISVYAVAALHAQGAPKQELLETFPALTEESLAAALVYAETHPRQGRPAREAPWRKAVPGESARPAVESTRRPVKRAAVSDR